MPPKKTEATAAAAPKAKSGSSHASYQAMITDAIINLKHRNGSSRPQLKKYVKANNTLLNVSDKMFDFLFNKALKAGVEKGLFAQPKGPSGGTKLAKKQPEAKKPAAPKKEKEAAAPATKKPAAKKAASPKKTKEVKEPKESAAKAEKKEKAPAKKAAAPKKAATAKKVVAADKPEKPETVLTKTKSGRVAKAQKPATPKKAAPKRAAASKKEKTAPAAAKA